jgi:DNA repair protein RecO (recombination protein O)
MLCPDCRLPGSATVSPDAARLLGALLAGDWAVVHETSPRHLREGSGLVAAYLAWHLERGLRSLEHVAR